MRIKLMFYLLTLVTLIGFPALGFALLWFFNDVSWNEFSGLISYNPELTTYNLLGLELGFFYGFIVLLVSLAPVFENYSKQQTHIIKGLKLNWFDVLLVSFSAGFGEEVLFRVGIQTWLGPWITTFLFIAIHGYFSLKNLKKNALGLLLLPLILLISFGYNLFGFWFSVAAHTAYDFVMFAGVLAENKERL